jgi:YD repeat-containing protein
LAEYAYYPNGSRRSLTLPNGITTTYAYDSLLRLEGMEHKNSLDELVASFDYTIGRTGKRAGVSENIGGTVTEWTYDYDGLDRLKTATRNGTEDEVFAYDLVGNRVSKTLGASTTTYTYDALDRLETETTGGVNTSYDYDGNGNLTAKTSEGQTESYVYDSRNRLRQVSSGPTGQGVLQYEFAYDYSGARFAKADLTGGPEPKQTDFLIDNNNLTGYSQTLLEIAHDSGMIQTRYEFGDDLYSQVRWDEATLPPPRRGGRWGRGGSLLFPLRRPGQHPLFDKRQRRDRPILQLPPLRGRYRPPRRTLHQPPLHRRVLRFQSRLLLPPRAVLFPRPGPLHRLRPRRRREQQTASLCVLWE